MKESSLLLDSPTSREEKNPMSDLSIPTPIPLFEYGHDGLPEGQLIVEDLLCQVVDPRAADGNPEVIDDLLAQGMNAAVRRLLDDDFYTAPPLNISDADLAVCGLVRLRRHTHDSRPGSECVVVAQPHGRGRRQIHISVDGHDPIRHRHVWFLRGQGSPGVANTDTDAIMIAKGMLDGTYQPCDDCGQRAVQGFQWLMGDRPPWRSKVFRCAAHQVVMNGQIEYFDSDTPPTTCGDADAWWLDDEA
jgi:hypothetical protein